MTTEEKALFQLDQWASADHRRYVEIGSAVWSFGLVWTVKLLPGVVVVGRKRRPGEPETEPGKLSRFVHDEAGKPGSFIEVVQRALDLHDQLFPNGESDRA